MFNTTKPRESFLVIDAAPFSSNRAFTAAHTSAIICSLSAEARTARGCKSVMAPSAGMVSMYLVTISRGVPDRTAMNRQSRTHDARRDSGCCVQLPRWCARRSVLCLLGWLPYCAYSFAPVSRFSTCLASHPACGFTCVLE